MTQKHLDVLIVGAGISGISAACHLKRDCPNKQFAILERRQAIGGTWDLFRYPGIRSDSDMSTFGFNFKPWTASKVLADGESIKAYVHETADQYHLLPLIHFGRKVQHAAWSSSKNIWTLTVLNEATGATEQWTADFMIGCTGYYNYDQGFKPTFEGESDFGGQVTHPQHWPENLDYRGKRVVVIGSGATAVTLVPSMAADVAHITMLQRSPSYVASVPSVDKLNEKMKQYLPEMVAYRITRARNIGLQRFVYEFAKKQPKVLKNILLSRVKRQVDGYVDMKHFTPSYNPWDERLCAVPSGDLFKALRSGKASIVTDHIERFTKTGILLKSGQHLDADIIVSATGLNVQMMGGASLDIDGKAFAIDQHMTYKGVLVENVPNAAIIFGYTNASWTLKADIASEYICRLINHMQKKGYKTVMAKDLDNCKTEDTVLGGLRSGYIRRAAHNLPKQGNKAPWVINNNYLADRLVLQKGKIEDRNLTFSKA